MEVERVVSKGPEEAQRKLLAKLDEVVIKYNANVLKLCDLSWFDDEYAPGHSSIWKKVTEDEIRDLNDEEFDLVKLENEALRENEREVLHNWQLLHPRTSTSKVTDESSSSSPTKTVKTTSSIPATNPPVIPEYNPDDPHLPAITSKGGMSLVSFVFDKAQMSLTVVANLFLILSHVISQPPIDPHPVASQDVTLTVTTRIFNIVRTCV